MHISSRRADRSEVMRMRRINPARSGALALRHGRRDAAYMHQAMKVDLDVAASTQP
jgi:hypothetical protein